jgi:Xaa-Pro aminopeptidase
MLATYEQNLLESQIKARQLLKLIEDRNMIRVGVSEKALTEEIYQLALEQYGTKKHWHKRIVRTGSNAALSIKADTPDRTIEQDDLVYVDLGPVFDEFEGDIGKTYLMGKDLEKQKLLHDLENIFDTAKTWYLERPDMSGAELWSKVEALTEQAGWQFGNIHAGHIIGEFSHKQKYGDLPHHRISPLNDVSMTAPDTDGRPHHWILEIHLIDKAGRFGGFFEDLLTLN